MRRLGHVELPAAALALRAEVRRFVRESIEGGLFEPAVDAWHGGFSPELSRALGERGWLGMGWPAQYGGHERSALEQFVVREELLAAGAPVAAHWVADRQSGPQILRHGSEEARRLLLPGIARGECYFALGMSEPESGSDLASIRSVATAADGGFRLNGSKVWTSHADQSHYMTVLCRTSPANGDRHDGMSVLIVPADSPGVTASPIRMLDGRALFCEVTFEDVFVSANMVLGEVGEGWRLITSELALERSGPERILTTYPLLRELAARSSGQAAHEIGMLVAQLWTLRRLSLAVAAEIDSGRDPATEAALVKDLGTEFEHRVVDTARKLISVDGGGEPGGGLEASIMHATLASPGFTIRGGTTEILRTIVARTVTAGR